MNNCLTFPYYNKKHQFHLLLIWIAYSIVTVQNFLSWHLNGIDQILRYVIAICLIVSLDFSKWDKFKIFLLLFLVIALILRRLLIVWTLLCLVYQIDYFKLSLKDLTHVALILVCFELFLQTEGVLIGLLKNTAVKYIKSNSFTYDLGTGNANRCAGLFFKIIVLLYLKYRNNNHSIFFFSSVLLGIISYKITGSRTPFICSFLIMGLAILYWKQLIPKSSKFIIAILPIVFFILTFYLAFNLNENKELNEAASGRLWYIVKLTQEFTIKDWLIGAPRTTDDPLDSAYLEIIHTGGILLALFFIIAFAKTTLVKFNEIKSFIPIILPMLLGGLTEAILLRPTEISVIFWVIMMQSFIKYKPRLTT